MLKTFEWLAVIQTGRLCQRLMVETNNHEIGLCPIGGMNFVPISSALLPKYGQIKVLHCLVCCLLYYVSTTIP